MQGMNGHSDDAGDSVSSSINRVRLDLLLCGSRTLY